MSVPAVIILCLACYGVGMLTVSLFAAGRIREADDRAELAEYQRGQLMETIAERTDQAGRKEAVL